MDFFSENFVKFFLARRRKLVKSPFTRFFFNRTKQEEQEYIPDALPRKEPVPSSRLLLLLLLLEPKNNKAKVERTHSNPFFFVATWRHAKKSGTKSGALCVCISAARRGERGNVHFRGNCTEAVWAVTRWHGAVACRTGVHARNWAMCRLARPTALYEHCGENIWFSRWPSATVKFRPHCFERRNVDRRWGREGRGEGGEEGLRGVERRGGRVGLV